MDVIIVGMFGGRTSAMGFNRLVDQQIDAKTREHWASAGPRRPRQSLALGLATTTGLLFLAAYMLHPMALLASPLIVAILWGYSLAKRFTSLCHLWLGAALGSAPIAVWIALRGRRSTSDSVGSHRQYLGRWIRYLVCIAGSDFRRCVRTSQHSGQNGRTWRFLDQSFSPSLHVGRLLSLPEFVTLGWPYWIGVLSITAVLIWEHRLIRPGDLSQMNKAFFTANSTISLLFLAAIVAATL